MWDEEDGFFYDVLRLPDGQRDAAEGALDGRPAAALRGRRFSRPSMLEQLPGVVGTRPKVPRAHPGPGAEHLAQATSRAWRARAGCSRCSTRRSCGGCCEGCSTRRSSSVPTGSARSRATTRIIRSCSTTTGRSSASPIAGRIGHGHVRRKLELARTDLDAGQCLIINPAAYRLLRGRFQGGVSHRLGKDEPLKWRRRSPPA